LKCVTPTHTPFSTYIPFQKHTLSQVSAQYFKRLTTNRPVIRLNTSQRIKQIKGRFISANKHRAIAKRKVPGKVKVKLFLCLTKHHAMKMYGVGSGTVTPQSFT